MRSYSFLSLPTLRLVKNYTNSTLLKQYCQSSYLRFAPNDRDVGVGEQQEQTLARLAPTLILY